MQSEDPEYKRLLARVNLEKFTETLGYKNARHHKEIYRKLQNPKVKRLLIIMPPGHGKSTCATVNFPLWEVGGNPDLRLIIASHTKDFVASFIREISQHMQSPDYIEVFGNLKPQRSKWTENELIVARDSVEKDPTFTALSTGQGIIGRRADLVICDDIIDENYANSEKLRQSVKNWFNKELLTRLEPNGRVIVIGTRWHFADLYDHLLKDEAYERLIFPAINEANEALWPEKWPLEILLARKKEIGSIAFSSQYLCNPTPQEGAIFKAEWLHYWHETDEDPTKRIYKAPPRGKLLVYQGWDLAISENPEADYTVGLTIGISDDRRIYVLDYQRDHWDFPTQAKMVEVLNLAWRPLKIAIESNAYQKALPQYLRKRVIPVVEVKQDKNKLMRLTELAPYFENGTIRIGMGQDELLLEYLQYPKGEHDDILDALHIAFTAAKTQSPYLPGSRPITRVLE